MTFPYDITGYDIDVICSHISFTTGTPFHLVKQKKQLSYLDNYLRSPEISANIIIIENSYLEKNYVENFAEYYSRCFHPYSKICSRIHFFHLTTTSYNFFLHINKFFFQFTFMWKKIENTICNIK